MEKMEDPRAEASPFTVKLMGRMSPEHFAMRFTRQLPRRDGCLGSCRFSLDWNLRTYDWLVVYHDLYRAQGKLSLEPLACPRERTILVTTEPSTITVYGTDYLRQFGTIITSQEPWVIRHPNAVFTQPGLVWFYGIPYEGGKVLNYEDLEATPPIVKTKDLATVCSNRKGNLTLHTRRVAFTQRLQEAIPDMDVFGHGVRPMSDKAEALDPYRYHITIENHVYPHHMTEKLPDAFLGYTLPFYHGCPNAADYFPKESFIPIDFNDFEKTRDIIQSTIANREYEDRLPYILEARRRVLEEHNFFAVIERYIRNHPEGAPCVGERSGTASQQYIMNRPTLRIRKPLAGVRTLLEKVEIKGRHWMRRTPAPE
jgi:hypothetical protein